MSKERKEKSAGHSLGGALGTLASYDFASLPLIKKADVKVTCITFGAPRTGNRQFSKEFQVEPVPFVSTSTLDLALQVSLSNKQMQRF